MIKTRLNIKNKILLLLVVAGMMASCGNSYEEQRRLSRAERARLHKEDSLALKVAVMPTLDCMPLFLAKEHCLYDTARLDLRLRYFTAQMDCDTAIAGRSVEGLVSDLVRTERLRREGVPLDYLSSANIYWQLFTNHQARLKRIDQRRQDGGHDQVFCNRHAHRPRSRRSENVGHGVPHSGERR